MSAFPFRTAAICAALAAALLAGSRRVPAQAPPSDTAKKTAPNSELPLIPTRPLRFTTDEGTWMSLDVSPDGGTIVFDLLGDLYTIPIAGGAATRITSGSGFDGQPRWSPDGRTIVFVSDRSGSDNLWLAAADGSRQRALTSGRNAQYISPEWTPDGAYVVTSRNNGGNYDLWMFHRDGGNGLRLTGASTPAAGQGPPPPGSVPFTNFLGAAFGKDARYLYAAGRSGVSQYNQMMGANWQLLVYDRETGRSYTRTTNLGAGFRPALSPDGRWLAYASRKMARTGLKLRDMTSGDERWVAEEIQRDDMESRPTRDVLPGYSWTPDSRAIVLSHHGKFWRLDPATGRETMIPFTAEVDQMMGELARFDYELNDSTLAVRQIRGARPSPDGRRVVFSALDKVYVMDVGGAAPRRLTSATQGEHSPAWSPDGRFIAWVTWSEDGGDIWRVAADGRGRPERLTTQTAYYDDIAYSPDGARIVAARGPRSQREIRNDEINGGGPSVMELVWLSATGGGATLITPLSTYGRPHFTRDTSRIYLYESSEGLVSMRWDGTDRKAHLKVTGFAQPGAAPNAQPRQASEIQVSPDGQRAIAQVDNKVFLVPVPMTGGVTPSVSTTQPNGASLPVRRITRTGGDFLGWSRDGRSFFYSLGHSFFTYDVARGDSAVRDSVTAAAARAPGATAPKGIAYAPTRLDASLVVPKDRPSGSVVLRNARLITMRGDEMIERGDILITNNRIAALGASGSVSVPAGTRSIDVSGKTIMPGLVDIHAHMWPLWGVHKTQVYMYLANLAYGVTTTRDPQTSTTDVLSYGDLVETGDMIGPRILSTGPGVFLYDDVSSADDARDLMKRYSEFYQTQTLKQYMAGDRRQRQWIVTAAREQRITPTLEGGLDFKKNMTEAMDGYAGIEHTLPIAPIAKDAVQLFAKSGTTWTPTLLVQYGGPWAENYWYETYDIFADRKLTHFTPFTELEWRGLRRPQWFRDSEYSFSLFAEQAKKIVEAGGRVGLGGHGQLQGLGVHWELWSIASGGMKPHDALRVATIFGAEAIGMGQHLGSLEGGKLADLLVLNANPLENIRNTNTIQYVMKNGRMYEGETLNEIWPRQKPLGTMWWTANDPAPVIPGGARP
ncbi:MAG: amidohydrolase family protein [Gemmatimonadaceae bacterium]